MAVTNLTEITPLIGLNGSELVYIVQFDALTQTWIDYTTTTGAISAFFSGITTSSPSMRQLKAAMAQTGDLINVDENIPGDITNTNYIAWNSAFRMTATDPFVTGFLVPMLGQSEVNTIFALAPSFPV